MNRFKYGIYKFSYFNKIHIESLSVNLILFVFFLIIPYWFSDKQKRKFEKVIGIISILTKLFDSIYRIIYENERIMSTLPLHLCNLSLIIGGIYLITKKNIFFNITYFWFLGAILAVILPGIYVYHIPIYVYIFMITHFLEIFIVLYGFIHNDEIITKKGLIVSILMYLIVMLFAYLVNIKFNTNYMFISDYIIGAVSFIKPFLIYQTALISFFILSMIIMYLPFININTEEVEEEKVS